jgi:hypothetical protein
LLSLFSRSDAWRSNRDYFQKLLNIATGSIMTTILSIVARLPPAIDGVGDYADSIAATLAAKHGISTQFIACDPLQPAQPGMWALAPIQIEQRSSESLLASLDLGGDIDILLLHYVGYGYAKRGCPLWLVAALRQWRKAKSSRRLVTMFHEVYASSNRPWSSQFWTSSIQKKIATDLVNCSDLVMTNAQIYAETIAKLSPKHHGNIQVLPMFSTVGADVSVPLAQRQPWLVTFGNTSHRQAIYTDSLEQLTAICQQLEISEIYDIGKNSAEIVRPVPQVKVNAMGILTASEISQILRMARVGFINYPLTYIAKSTIFAAYASHKILPVFDRSNIAHNQDGVSFERHYWSLQTPGDTIDLATAHAIANNAHQWYADHDLEHTASRVAKLLRDNHLLNLDRSQVEG